MKTFRLYRSACPLLWLFVWASPCFAESIDRSSIIEQALDCVTQNLATNDEIGWSDICYSWEGPPDNQREKAINDALDDYEDHRTMYERPFAHPDYPQLSDSWGKSLSTYEPRQSRPTQDEVKDWLKSEYPYFYEEQLKREHEEKIFYGDEDFEKKDSTIASILKHIDYGLVVESDEKPTYYFETVFPLFQTDEKKHTLFSHDRISVSSGDGSYSAGAGYRYFNEDYPYILGFNTFYDYQQDGHHYRLGHGAEFIGEKLEGRLNYYNALSDKRGGPFNFEQAIDGFDVEVGTSVPTFPLAKVFGGYQWYNTSHSDSQRGWKTRLELKPAPSVALNLGTVDENDHDIRYRFDGRLNFSFSSFDPKDIVADIKGESITPVQIKLEDRLLDRVEREFRIKTEKWVEGAPEIITATAFIQIVNPCVACNGGADNLDGILDPGEGFEINVFYTNLRDVTVTNIILDNESMSNTTDFVFTVSAPNILADAPPNTTVFTVNPQDFDLTINAGAAIGSQTFISFDVISDQGTDSFTFGPIIVGTTRHGDIISN